MDGVHPRRKSLLFETAIVFFVHYSIYYHIRVVKKEVSMESVSPNRVWLQYRDGVTESSPIVGRMYTMTHSDETADLFVSTGEKIASDRIGDLRDEVILRWTKWRNGLALSGEVLVTKDRDRKNAEFRNQIFEREMPTALAAIRIADDLLFQCHPELDDTPVYIHFISCFP